MSQIFYDYSLESADAIRYAGQTVTLSFYARAGANFSATSNYLNVLARSGTGTDQTVTGYTGSSDILNQNIVLTTTAQRFTQTFSIPSNSTEFGFQFSYIPTGTAGANDYFDITGVQIDIGSNALPYRRYSATLQGELEACQRYYFRATSPLNAYGTLAMGSAISTSIIRVSVKTPVTMRVTPTTIDFSTLFASDGVGGSALTTCIGATSTPDYPSVDCGGGSGLTQYRPYALTTNNSTSGYLGFSAEL